MGRKCLSNGYMARVRNERERIGQSDGRRGRLSTDQHRRICQVKSLTSESAMEGRSNYKG